MGAGTFVLLEREDLHAKLGTMKAEAALSVEGRGLQETRTQRLFYSVFVPLGAVVNMVLGVTVLAQMKPDGMLGWLQLGTGALCCAIAGWLGASAWSKSYWNRSMARQIALWRRIADAFFTWLEDAPLPAEALHRLKSSLDEVVPTGKRG
jgi:hypothetical protein